jgi:hypothetical protein
MARLLIITGPQGSGNHVFSKCLAVHEDVYGWKSLLNTYWEGHHHEPFAKYWNDPELLHEFDWTQKEHYVTSISCPFVKNKEPHIPTYEKFIEVASKYCEVSVAIIGRDVNILQYQQQRVRKKHTTPMALDAFKWLLNTENCSFLSLELLYLYKQSYLEQLSNELDWPIAFWDPEIDAILSHDANEKYIKDVHEYWLDFEVDRAIKES